MKTETSQVLDEWAIAYLGAIALITLGVSIRDGLSGTHASITEIIDQRAANLATLVVTRLKGER